MAERKFSFARNLKSIQPAGWIMEFLRRQQKGLSGNLLLQGYPFDTVMWSGQISPIRFQGCEYNAPELPVPPGEAWWPYEQSAYLLDGIVRLGILLNDSSMLDVYRKNLYFLLDNPDKDGRLGGEAFGLRSMWPMAVFFRSVWAYYMAGGGKEKRIIEAFHRHYSLVTVEELADEFRSITNLEGLVICGMETGDTALLAKAEAAYARFNERIEAEEQVNELSFDSIRENRRQFLHGVTFCEEVKIPVLLYLATGKDEYLQSAEKNLARVFADHEQPGGMISAEEYLSGRDPNQGYELCVMVDLCWSLRYFFEATGKVEYLDRCEKIMYNAFPGATDKTFTAFEYFSSVNQVVASKFSNSVHVTRGEFASQQFRLNHYPQCCGGQLHRGMPAMVGNLWGTGADGAVSALCFGPSEYSCEINGTGVSIKEETDYPFGDSIKFCWETNGCADVSFRFRVPRWCNGVTVAVNGENCAVVPENGWVTLHRIWRNGDNVTVDFDNRVVVHRDRNWQWLERGPLLFVYPVECRKVDEFVAEGFSHYDLVDPAPWNYALPVSLKAEDVKVSSGKGEGYPVETPAISLRVPAVRIGGGYEVLELERYTPDIPLFVHEIPDSGCEIELVPYATTLTRIGAFPVSGIKRTPLPPVIAFAYGPYPYNCKMPLAEQKFMPEIPAGRDLSSCYDLARRIYPERDGYYDLQRHFGTGENVMGYIAVKFWAEKTGRVTVCASLSDGGEGFINGEKLFTIDPVYESRFMAGEWFDCDVKQGYNYLLLKVVDVVTPWQFFKAWGGLVQIFYQEI